MAPPAPRFVMPPVPGFRSAPATHGAAPAAGFLAAAPGFHGAARSSTVAVSSTAAASATATSVTNVTINNRFFDGLAFSRFHHHVFVDFFFFGGPVFVGPWFGFWDPFWFPPPVVIQESPPVYVQQPPTPTYWYYCADAKAYYPYVQECPGGWLTVVPTL